jgi:ABC-2 type transport system permease protein
MTAQTLMSRSSKHSVRRIAALARAESTLLLRDRLALLNGLIVPAAMVVAFKSSGVLDVIEGLQVGAIIVTNLAGFALTLSIYYNLVTAIVARREGLVLKRLRTGECTDTEILAGTAGPAIAVAWIQVSVATVAAMLAFGMGLPRNGLLIAAALAMGTVTFVLLAVISTAFTRTVEMAQVTTLPVLFLPLAFSGLFFPLAALPEALERIGQVLPLTPVVDLLRLGLAGTTRSGRQVDLAGTFSESITPLLILAAWIAAGVWASRQWFRWEPRR